MRHVRVKSSIVNSINVARSCFRDHDIVVVVLGIWMSAIALGVTVWPAVRSTGDVNTWKLVAGYDIVSGLADSGC